MYKKTISAVKWVECISDRISYITLRGRWCDIVLHVPEPNEVNGDMKGSFHDELQRSFHQFQKYGMKILLGEYRGKLRREDIFKPTIGNESLHEISYDNGVSVVNSATSKI
jgi:hypothetical protein